MLRFACAVGVAAVLCATAGCRMCCHPYDYSGPVYHGGGCLDCGSRGRAGSILEGRSGIVVEEMPPGDFSPPEAPPSQSDLSEHRQVVPSKEREVKPVPSSISDRSAQVASAEWRTRKEAKPRQTVATVSRPAPAADSQQPTDAEIQRMIQRELRAGDVPGSERIVSITERVVGESETASEAPDRPFQELPASGWTARRWNSDARR